MKTLLTVFALDDERIDISLAAKKIGASQKTFDAPAKTVGSPAKTIGSSAKTVGSSVVELDSAGNAAQSSFMKVETVLTGVGKTQAAGTLALALRDIRPDYVLNIGTVGTYRHRQGDILVARRFIDRDMTHLPIDDIARDIDMSALSFAPHLPSIIDGQESLQPITINTGDNFVTSEDEDLGCDAVDMEAFAEAWVCRKAGVPFLSVKYVTDILGQNSIRIWADRLRHAREALTAYFEKYADRIEQDVS